MAKCTACEFQFKLPEDDLNDIYAYVYDTGEYVNNRGASSVNRPERSYVPDFLANHVHPGGLILEIGPGAAGNLLYAKELGFGTATLDVSDWNNKYFRDICGFDHVYQNMESIPDESLDGVIATHVIEHVQKPFEFLQILRTKMKPGAKLLIGTPNCDFPYTTLFGNRWWVYGVDDHVSFFKSENLDKLLALTQFTEIQISTHNSNGCHSVSWFLKSGIRGNPYGLRSRNNASTSAPATGTGSDSASKLEAPSNPVRISGNRFRKWLEFPFARLAKAGYGYELVAVCKR